MRHRSLIIIVLAALLGSAAYFLFISESPVPSASKATLSTVAKTDPPREASVLVKGDLLPTSWALRRGTQWSESTITAKKGDSISTILPKLGATPDEIKEITA